MITLPPENLSPSLLEYIVKQQELITRQQRQIAQLMEQNVQLQARIEVLEAEIIRLKKLNPKPNIKPGSLLFRDYSHGQGFFNIKPM
ncbi:septum formation initiator family protein [Endozoicomonas euniceicola]|uniref:Septum formation initiator family protein n=1 Tax=Endozoicomonas euniceicola TaxID=1234143 RepID=A0ABY6GYP9_9GAMM|nr:septum formation initiator family protein [Endozoicomonas euniceicola]UYM17915.1 septum formation initiator family protein [Endozoicomonas euniceicola]